MRLRATALAVALLVTGCGGPAKTPTYAGEVLLPTGTGPAAVVVLVPGGSWRSADPTGLLPLARYLADAGYVAATTTYRAADAGARFPTPVQDVLCAAAGAVADAVTAGRGGGPLVLAGHSAGAQLAVLAALRPAAFRRPCEDPAVTPDAVVGLAGAYDVRATGGMAVDLFGATEQERPQLWREGDPLAWAQERPSLPVLLLHGAQDDLVPVEWTERLATALRAGGHAVRTATVDGADHHDIYAADVAGPPLRDWLSRLRAAAGAPPP